MSKHLIAAVAVCAILVGSAGPARGKDVPVEIRWSGVAPTDVLLTVPGGVESLTRDTQASVFRGVLSAPDDAPQRHTITVRYGNYYHPFDVRLQPPINRIVFKVDHSLQRSCTRRKVNEANASAGSLPEAIKRAVDAGELMSIREPNACNSTLRFSAAQARLRQAAAMSEFSDGLFLISNRIKNEYREAARRRGETVETEIASLEKRDDQLEVRQLLALRTEAHQAGDFLLAMEVNDYMAGRLNTNQQMAALYASQGVTNADLASDQREIRLAINPPSGSPIMAGERGEE